MMVRALDAAKALYEKYPDACVVALSCGGCVLLIACVFWLWSLLRSPFRYPYLTVTYKVPVDSGETMDGLVERFLRDGGARKVRDHEDDVRTWKANAWRVIEYSRWKSLRKRQFDRCLDDENSVQFMTVDETGDIVPELCGEYSCQELLMWSEHLQ